MTAENILIGIPSSPKLLESIAHHIDVEIDNSLSLTSFESIFALGSDILITEEFSTKFLKRLLLELVVNMVAGQKVIFARKWGSELQSFGILKVLESHFKDLFIRIANPDRNSSALILVRSDTALPQVLETKITGYSICVLTTIGDKKYFMRLAESIKSARQSLEIDTELIIMDTTGNTLTFDFLDGVKILHRPDLQSNLDFGLKKNLLASEARYSEIVMLHDRFLLTSDFFEKNKKTNTRFAMSSPRVMLPDGRRGLDWAVVNSSNLSFSVGGLINYRDYSNYLYSPGGAVVVRKAAWEVEPWSEIIGWNEHEDVEMSMRYRDRGFMIGLNPGTLLALKDRWVDQNKRIRFSTHQDILPAPPRGEFTTLFE